MEAPDEPSIGPKLWVMEASALLLGWFGRPLRHSSACHGVEEAAGFATRAPATGSISKWNQSLV